MLTRTLPVLMLAAVGFAADQVPPALPRPAPANQPMSMPITMQAPKTISTVRLVDVDGNGPTAAGQKILDAMQADGWRSTGLSTVSAPDKVPATVAILFSKVAPKEAPAPAIQPAPAKP